MAEGRCIKRTFLGGLWGGMYRSSWEGFLYAYRLISGTSLPPPNEPHPVYPAPSQQPHFSFGSQVASMKTGDDGDEDDEDDADDDGDD